MEAIRYHVCGVVFKMFFPLPDEGNWKSIMQNVVRNALAGQVYHDRQMRLVKEGNHAWGSELISPKKGFPHAAELRAAVQGQGLVFCQAIVKRNGEGGPATISFADGVELVTHVPDVWPLEFYGIHVFGRDLPLIARVNTRVGVFLISPWWIGEQTEYPIVLHLDPIPTGDFIKVVNPLIVKGEDWDYTPTQVGKMALDKAFPKSWTGYQLGHHTTFGTELGAGNEQPFVRFMFLNGHLAVIHPDGTHARVPDPVWKGWGWELIPLASRQGLVAIFEDGQFRVWHHGE